MRGETVTILRPVVTGTDEGGNPIVEYTRHTVDNVLVDPASDSQADDTNRPQGADRTLTVQFPRAWHGGSLAGCLMIVRGNETTPWQVVGDPMALDGGMTPTAWNMSVPLIQSQG